MEDTEKEGLCHLIRRGGVLYHAGGTTPTECLTRMIQALDAPAPIDRGLLLKAVLEREALMSTAVGYGIALPHPRNPLITDPACQFVTTAFFDSPVGWQALDGEPVHTAMLIVSASAQLHLVTLSRINFLCRQESFRRLMKNRESPEIIAAAITEAEQAWQ
jgi:PTS system nitrogen regulatory IIA component